MNSGNCSWEEASSSRWDTIVVGTGIGGATVGFRLAERGQRVLFLEKGLSFPDDTHDAYRDRHAENFLSNRSSNENERDVFLKAGRFIDSVTENSKARPHEFVPFLGLGWGGTSRLYGMIMERFFPADFEPGQFHDATKSDAIPDRWPITYEELRPYYQSAEKLYGVRGEIDPLRGPALMDEFAAAPPLSPVSQYVTEFLQAKDLHPYRVPMACDYVEDCKECVGFPCGKNCKNDSSKVCLKPALQNHSARIIPECEVIRLNASKNRVTSLECRHHGEYFNLSADRIVLAAGAMITPFLLLKSTSDDWPEGLANRSGRVGRYLMRHLFDSYALKLDRDLVRSGRTKETAFNDFYFTPRGKGGTVQSIGKIESPNILVRNEFERLKRTGHPLLSTMTRFIQPLLTPIIRNWVTDRYLLTGILEDTPQEANRVSVSSKDPNRPAIQYKISAGDRVRLREFRRLIKKSIRPISFTFLAMADNNEWLPHACGTVRFGDDPQTSVLDKNNRAHDLENLYVVDSSFFPTSSGTNPSLTIAANALRVADHIVGADR